MESYFHPRTTRVGVANTRTGVSSTGVGVSNTRAGVSDGIPARRCTSLRAVS